MKLVPTYLQRCHIYTGPIKAMALVSDHNTCNFTVFKPHHYIILWFFLVREMYLELTS